VATGAGAGTGTAAALDGWGAGTVGGVVATVVGGDTGAVVSFAEVARTASAWLVDRTSVAGAALAERSMGAPDGPAITAVAVPAAVSVAAQARTNRMDREVRGLGMPLSRPARCGR
jgi:hypothetical protein